MGPHYLDSGGPKAATAEVVNLCGTVAAISSHRPDLAVCIGSEVGSSARISPQSLTVVGAVVLPPPRIRRVHGVGGSGRRPESGYICMGGGSGAPILYRKKNKILKF